MMNEDLVAGVMERRTILFAGSGLSATLGVPTWKGLIDYMSAELGYDPRVLAPPGVNYLTLGEYFRLNAGEKGIAKLAQKMADEWNVKPEKLIASQIYRSLYDLDFPTVYTTNYDHNLENAFHQFGGSPVVVRGVADLPASTLPKQVIVKFHGDLAAPDELVLGESDYFHRLGFESPLDIRLRSDALNHTILFIGYSLTDINIRLLLYKLSRMWEGQDPASRPRSFLLLQRPNEMEQTVLASWGIEVLTHDVDDPSCMLSDFLRELNDEVSSARRAKLGSA